MYNVFYRHWGNVVKPILDALGYSSVKCTFADDSSKPHCSNQLVFGGAPLVHLHFFPQDSMAKGEHLLDLDSAFLTMWWW